MRIYDCILYNGEIDALENRLNVIGDVVDVHVIVEAVWTFEGVRKPPRLRTQWPRIRRFARKIRYVVIDGEDPGPNAWSRERFQRNGLERGLLDAADEDLVIVANVGEVPPRAALVTARTRGPEAYAFAAGEATPSPDTRIVPGLPYAALKRHDAASLRQAMLDGSLPGCRIDHPSSDAEDVDEDRGCRDVAANDDWSAGAATRSAGGRPSFRRLFRRWPAAGRDPAPDVGPRGLWSAFSGRGNRPSRTDGTGPVILCPYVAEADRQRVVAAFGLDDARGRRLPVHLWMDRSLRGPERAYEEGWKAFPGRDVILLHTDMAPMPDDPGNAWYEDLLATVDALPAAGLIGCDLLFPMQAPSGEWYVQSAGGWLDGAQIGHVGGSVDLKERRAAPAAFRYDATYGKPRPVDWVTFGGVYIRREVIDMVGDFDRDYRWAYVMDVDYAVEARLRGSLSYQVPVNLLHEENGSTRALLDKPEYRDKVRHNHRHFREKWLDLIAASVDGTWMGVKLARRHREPLGGQPDEKADKLGRWLSARTGAFKDEIRTRGTDFEIAAYARALGVSRESRAALADVRRAYLLVLGREIDPISEKAWEDAILRNEPSVGALLSELCRSGEYLKMVSLTHS